MLPADRCPCPCPIELHLQAAGWASLLLCSPVQTFPTLPTPSISNSLCSPAQPFPTRSAAFCPEALVVESLQRMADWCLRYARDEDRRGGLPPIPSSSSIASECMCGAKVFATMLHVPCHKPCCCWSLPCIQPSALPTQPLTTLPSLPVPFAVMSADAQVRHGAFYAACQALLYVLCYHMEPLLRPKHKHHHQQHAAGAGGAPASLTNGSLAAGVAERQQAAQQGAAAGVPSSLGTSGGTPASMDGLPGSLRSHERRDAAHAQVRCVRRALCVTEADNGLTWHCFRWSGAGF